MLSTVSVNLINKIFEGVFAANCGLRGRGAHTHAHQTDAKLYIPLLHT